MPFRPSNATGACQAGPANVPARSPILLAALTLLAVIASAVPALAQGEGPLAATTPELVYEGLPPPAERGPIAATLPELVYEGLPPPAERGPIAATLPELVYEGLPPPAERGPIAATLPELVYEGLPPPAERGPIAATLPELVYEGLPPPAERGPIAATLPELVYEGLPPPAERGPIAATLPELVYEGLPPPVERGPITTTLPELVYEGLPPPAERGPIAATLPELVYEGLPPPAERGPIAATIPELLYQGEPPQELRSGRLPRERRGVTVRLLRVSPLDGRVGLDPFDFREVERRIVEAREPVQVDEPAGQTDPITFMSFMRDFSGDPAVAGPAGSPTSWQRASAGIFGGVTAVVADFQFEEGMVYTPGPGWTFLNASPGLTRPRGTPVTLELRDPQGRYYRVTLTGTTETDDFLPAYAPSASGVFCGSQRC